MILVKIINFYTGGLLAAIQCQDTYKLPENHALWVSGGNYYFKTGHSISSDNKLFQVTVKEFENKNNAIDGYNMYRVDEAGFLIPEGMFREERALPDGIWYCHHTGYSVGTTSISYIARKHKANEILDENGQPIVGMFRLGNGAIIDIDNLCGLEEYTSMILGSEELKDVISTGYTLNDFVSLIVSLVFQKNLEIKNNEGD